MKTASVKGREEQKLIFFLLYIFKKCYFFKKKKTSSNILKSFMYIYTYKRIFSRYPGFLRPSHPCFFIQCFSLPNIHFFVRNEFFFAWTFLYLGNKFSLLMIRFLKVFLIFHKNRKKIIFSTSRIRMHLD